MEDIKLSIPELPRITPQAYYSEADLANKVNELIEVANGHSKIIEMLVETLKKLAGLVEHHDKFLRQLKELLGREGE